MSEMTEEQKAEMEELKQSIIASGLEYGGDEIPKDLDGDPRVVKVNLPELDSGGFKTGNGEGCWAYIRKPEDIEKYDKGRGTFEVILLNSSVYYMGFLLWGSVITVEGRGQNRPVLNEEWIKSKIGG